MKLISKFLLLLFLFSQHVNLAQEFTGQDLGSYKKNFLEGSLLFHENNKILALKYFNNAYQYDQNNSNINYLIGACYLSLENKKQFAEKHLLQAVKNITKNYKDSDPSEKKAPVVAFMYLAKAFLFSYKFSEAEEMLALFDSQMKKKDEIARIESEAIRNQIKYARIFYGSPSSDVQINSLEGKINSEFPDFYPIVSQDEEMIVFASRRKNNLGNSQTALDGFTYEDVFVSYKDGDGTWSEPKSISDNINSFSAESPVGLSFDGQTLILQKDDLGDANLYYSNWDGNDWTFPEPFGSNINSEQIEGSACFNLEKNAIYFSSDREGGFGGMDIYRSVKLPNGQWSLAQNLGPSINTPLNEDCPFLTADGRVLYFSSEGHQSMGGYDVMYAVLDEEGIFSNPINLGFPINSGDDELYFYPNFDNHSIYFASAREKSLGERDIFLAKKMKSFPTNVSLLKCKITNSNCDSFPTNILIKVIESSSGQTIGDFRPNKRNGKFNVILPPDQNFDFKFYQDNREIYSETFSFPIEFSNESMVRNYKILGNKDCKEISLTLDTTLVSKMYLDIAVFNNKKEGKAIKNAKILLDAMNRNSLELVTDSNGKTDKVMVKNGDNIKLKFFDAEKASSIFSFDIKQVASNEQFQKTFYWDEIFPSNNDQNTLTDNSSDTKNSIDKNENKILLDVLVYENKNSKSPASLAEFQLKGTDGSQNKYITDGEGKVTGINLKKNVNYQFLTASGELMKNSGLITTQGITKKKTFQKTLYLSADLIDNSEVPDNSENSSNRFKFYFKYNMNQIDVDAPEFKDFIASAKEIKTTKGQVNFKIKTSSSKVPTKKYKNNLELSNKRLKKSIDILLKALEKENISESEFVISKRSAVVSGPKYSGDGSNKSKYLKYQYVIIEAY